MSDISGDDLAASILADAGGAEPKKSKLLPTIATVGILTLVALAGGAGVGYLLGARPVPQAADPKAASEADAGSAPVEDAGEAVPDVVVKLATLTTNIASPASTMLRLDASIVIRPGDVENAELLAAEINNDTLTFLRTIDLAQIEGARGLLHLREDLRERAMLRSPGVADYLIQSLVAQ